MIYHDIQIGDEIIRTKLNFFFDYFTLVNQFIGLTPEFPFETPLSIMDKVVFQVENNRENCYKYLKKYFDELYRFDSVFAFIDEYKLREYFNTYRHLERSNNHTKGNKFEQEFDLDSFSKELKEIVDKEKVSLEGAIEVLDSYIFCEHSITEHIEDIKDITKIIVAYYRLKGYSFKATSKLPQRVFAAHAKNFIKQMSQNELDLLCISQRFKYLGEPELSKNFIVYFKIYNLVIQREFKLDEVEFIPFPFKAISKIKKRNEHFFNHPTITSLISKVVVSALDIEEGLNIAAKKVRKEIEMFRLLSENGLHLELNEYIVTDFEGQVLEISNFEDEIKRIQLIGDLDLKNNPFHSFKGIENEASKKFLELEHDYLKSLNNLEISQLWVYIEKLIGIKNKNRKVSSSLIILKAPIINKHINFSLGEAFFNPKNRNTSFDNLLKNEFIQLLDNEHVQISDFSFFKTLDSNQSIYFLVNEIIEIKKITLDVWRTFIVNTIEELQEYRNFSVHSTKINKYSYRKLCWVMPWFLKLLRVKIIEEISLNKNFNEIYDEFK